MPKNLFQSFLKYQSNVKHRLKWLKESRQTEENILFLSYFFSPKRMEFCTSPAQRSKRQKDVVPDSCYRRLKGILFFNRHTPVSNNKLKILLDERKDLSTALEDASTERRLPQEFRTWLEKCHRELDKEVRLWKDFWKTCCYAPWGGVLPIMAYTRRLRPKGVPFAGFLWKGRVINVDWSI